MYISDVYTYVCVGAERCRGYLARVRRVYAVYTEQIVYGAHAVYTEQIVYGVYAVYTEQNVYGVYAAYTDQNVYVAPMPYTQNRTYMAHMLYTQKNRTYILAHSDGHDATNAPTYTQGLSAAEATLYVSCNRGVSYVTVVSPRMEVATPPVMRPSNSQ